MELKLIISSDFWYVSNISILSAIIYVGKLDGGLKIWSQYFSKLFSIPRYWAYRPIPTGNSNISDQNVGKNVSETAVHINVGMANMIAYLYGYMCGSFRYK